MKFLLCLIGLGCATVTTPALATTAVVLPPPQSQISCQSNNPGMNNSDSGALHCQVNGANGNIALVPNGGIVAQAAESSGTYGDGVSATLNYYFEVLGPSSGPIPILVDTSLTATAAGVSYGFARLLIDGTYGATVCTDGTCQQGTAFNGPILLSVYSGTQHQIYLEAEATENYSFGGSSLASVDPYIHVDPTFADASLYQVLVSPGVGNAPLSAVPESATWGMMILGMGAIGSAMRRRRHKVMTGVSYTV